MGRSGNQTAANIYGARADEILVRWDSTHGFLFYKQDRRGNVVFVLNPGGAAIERYSYDAFGKPKIMDWWGNERAETLYGNRFMFTGREWLKGLGIYDYRNRMYHPGLARFLQTDPIGFGASDMNLFRYCGDDAVNRTDPDGLVSWEAGAGLTSWGNGAWSADGITANQDIVGLYQTIRGAIRNAVPGNDQQAGSQKEQGRLSVESANVAITVKNYTFQNPNNRKAGVTPHPKKYSFVSTRMTGPNQLALTYHLQIKVFYNLSRGPLNRVFAKLREPDHTHDFQAAQPRFNSAAHSVVGRRFDTRTDAAGALRSAVDPVVDRVFNESKHWDNPPY